MWREIEAAWGDVRLPEGGKFSTELFYQNGASGERSEDLGNYAGVNGNSALPLYETV